MKRKKGLKLVSVLSTVVLLVSVFVTPVAAGQENGRGRRNVPTPEIQHLDAEVQVLDGRPVMIAETRRGYVNTPVALPVVFSVDGQAIPLQRQGNGVVVPTEDGPVVVPLEDFDVVMIDGQLALVAEVNPKWILWGGAGGGAHGAITYGARVLRGETTFSWRDFGVTVGEQALAGAGTVFFAKKVASSLPR